MSVVMDMSTGKLIEGEFGAFGDAVLNAEWTSASPGLQLQLQQVQQRVAATHEVDAGAFIAAVCRNPR